MNEGITVMTTFPVTTSLNYNVSNIFWARVVSQSPRFSRSVPLLKSPHWLPCDSASCLALSPTKVFHLNNLHICSQTSRQQDSTDSPDRQAKMYLLFLEISQRPELDCFRATLPDNTKSAENISPSPENTYLET